MGRYIRCDVECSVDEFLAKHLAVLLNAAGAPLVGRTHPVREDIVHGKVRNLLLQRIGPSFQAVRLAG